MASTDNAEKLRKTLRSLKADSMTDRLAKMPVGGVEARVQLVKLGNGSAYNTLTMAKRQLTSKTMPVIARVRERYPERRFMVETANFIGNGGTVYAACMIQRTK